MSPTQVTTRAPTRIDFGGGWTDVPPYCEEQGGFVCNVAIARYATATAEPGTAQRDDVGAADVPLAVAAVRRFGLPSTRVTLASDFPVGAGLGGSSSASAAILGALCELRGDAWNLDRIAEDGRVIEVEDLGIAGGRQDHYAAVYGGALGLTFTDAVRVRRIELSDATRVSLERRLLLVYTGESRISGDTITAVLGAYRSREQRVVNALKRMGELARQMASALERGDLDELGVLVGEHWTHQRALDPAIPTARIDEIIATARSSGARGAKALGASGGGTVLVVAADDNVDGVRRAVEPLGTLLPFRIDVAGLKRID
jgi:D-glycero-alpha-D-manno-heptose-7-phosphate kinase